MTWLLLFGVAPAAASHHLMKIKEVFAGTSGQPSAQFVELQMHAANQTVQTGKQLIVYDASGAAIATYTFAANSAVGTNQSTILIATPQAARFFGVTPNLTIDPVIRPAGGKVCYLRPAPLAIWDCMSWGDYSGSSVGTGAPFNPAAGLVSGQSALRDISGGLNPALLEATDDTGDSAADFDLALPTPRTNAGATTSTEGTVAVSGGSLDYTAAAGDVANSVTLSGPARGRYIVSDAGAPLTAGAGCDRLTVNQVRCAAAGITQATLDAGAGKDLTRVATALPTTQHGGPGADRLSGGSGADTLRGEDGNDRLLGGDAADSLLGGAGNDVLDGGAGPDALSGQDRRDTATYAARIEAVNVTIDDLSDDGGDADGPVGARDNVATDVENLVGGSGDDTLAGSAGRNDLNGGPGADSLAGGDGVDRVSYVGRTEPVTVTIDDVADDGGASDGPPDARDNVATDVENLLGGSGADSLTGSAAGNVLVGGAGPDLLTGLGGVDTVSYAGRTAAVTVAIDGVADDGSSSDGPAGARDDVALDVENLVGGAGDDSLTGSGEGNRLTGLLGADILRGLEGDDHLAARDGVADAELDCDGGGADVVTVDAADPASQGCERIKTPEGA